MKNKSGFTLIELLVAITILGILSMVAIPNIVGVVKKNKDKQYIEDAKKLVSLAEYKFRANPSLLGSNSCIRMNMEYLGDDEFEESPSGKYNTTNSFVDISYVSNEYVYKVITIDNKGRGVEYTDSKNLFEDDSIIHVKNNPSSTTICPNAS